MKGLLTGYSHLQGHLFKMGLVDNPCYVRWKQAPEMVSCVLWDYKGPAALRFRHLGHNFLTSGDFANISVCKVSVLCSNCGAAECLREGLRNKSEMVKVQASLWYLPCCTQLYEFIHVKWTKPLYQLTVSILVLTSLRWGSTSCSASLNLTQLPLSLSVST
jgi:hypothetical protein